MPSSVSLPAPMMTCDGCARAPRYSCRYRATARRQAFVPLYFSLIQKRCACAHDIAADALPCAQGEERGVDTAAGKIILPPRPQGAVFCLLRIFRWRNKVRDALRTDIIAAFRHCLHIPFGHQHLIGRIHCVNTEPQVRGQRPGVTAAVRPEPVRRGGSRPAAFHTAGGTAVRWAWAKRLTGAYCLLLSGAVLRRFNIWTHVFFLFWAF